MSPWDKGHAEVEQLIQEGKLQKIPPTTFDEQTLRIPRNHLNSAENSVDHDLDGSYTLVYDAMRKSLVAVLAVQGLRATSKGGHVVIYECLRAQLSPEADNLLRAYDRMRRSRNNVEYPPVGAEGITADEVLDDIKTVREALPTIEHLLEVLPVF